MFVNTKSYKTSKTNRQSINSKKNNKRVNMTVYVFHDASVTTNRINR